MAHPFDNIEFGPNVVLMDISTGKIWSPWVDRVFGVSDDVIRANEKAKAEFNKRIMEKRLSDEATKTVKAISQIGSAYSRLTAVERCTATKEAADYILARGNDARNLVTRLAARTDRYSDKINLNDDGTVTITLNTIGYKGDLVCSNMTCAIAMILAVWW
jgi:hypothetical protein